MWQKTPTVFKSIEIIKDIPTVINAASVTKLSRSTRQPWQHTAADFELRQRKQVDDNFSSDLRTGKVGPYYSKRVYLTAAEVEMSIRDDIAGLQNKTQASNAVQAN